MTKNKSKIFLLILSLTIAFNMTLFTNSLIFKSNVENLNDTNIDLYELKVSGSEINITTPENKTYTEPMSGYYIATYGFENDDVGSVPNEWIDNSGSSCSAQISSEIGGHNKVMQLDDNGASTQSDPTQIFSATQEYGTVEYWWYKDSGTTHMGFTIRYGLGTDTEMILLWADYNNDGAFMHRPGGVDTEFATGKYHDQEWFHIRIDFECGTSGYMGLSQYSYDIYLNGVKEVSGASFIYSGSSAHNINPHTANARIGTVYFDAFGYSWDPDYTIGDNLNEGLLLSYTNATNLDWIGYSLDNQANKTILGNTTIPLPAEGTHSIQVFGNNSIGTMYQSEIRYFEIDTSPPVIQINSPDSNQFFGIIAPIYEIFITESHLNTTWYSLNNGITNITFSGLIGTINQTLWDNIIDGDVSMIFYANDTWGFESYTAITIRKETVPPISLISYIPYGGMNFVNISTTFTINADDGTGSGVSSIRYKINDSTWIEYTGPFDLSSYPYGEYNITYQSIDNVGNVEDEKSIIVRLVEIPSETPGIAGYNVFIVISIFTLIIGVIIKKRSKLKL